MAELKNDAYELSFTIPDSLTVRQQLRYRGLAYSGTNTAEVYTRLWTAALTIIQDWQCPAIPDPSKLDLDTETNPMIGNTIMYVAGVVASHVSDLDDIEKN